MVHQKEPEVAMSRKEGLRIRDAGRSWSRKSNRSHKDTCPF